MQLAEKFQLTLGQLQQQMTLEELFLWGAYFEIEHDKNKAAMKKSQRRY